MTAPQTQHKAFSCRCLIALATRERGNPQNWWSSFCLLPQFASAGDMRCYRLKEDEAERAINELSRVRVKMLSGNGKRYYVSMTHIQRWCADITKLLQSIISDYPLREGYPREDLRSRMFHFITKGFQILLLEGKDGCCGLKAKTLHLRV